tara:strand:+ start:253 stop:498 length:246 start_codon:yes stop_codon:yes gene_type:complete
MELKLPKHFKNQSHKVELKKGNYLFCMCGLSSDGVFCDSSHKSTQFKPIKFSIEKLKTVALCMCKKAKSMPFCDGTHRQFI